MDFSDSESTVSRSNRSGDSTSGAASSQTKPKGRKVAAHWKLEEEVSLLKYLYENRTGTDGLTFPKKTYMGAAAHIAQQFQNQKGGPKTNGVCKTKFSALRTSGFTWMVEKGATIDEHTTSAWAGYVKSNPAAKQFKSKGFDHFEIFDLLASGTKAKGINVL
ncbi:hypothetical protein DEU56DRAFT_759012 [Suillus clintonianus]|uniref:uncharacterized protein n=1 Tax=Suillus clintonianus TaxID=1904413 RepID=UPI001B87B0DF|nr:uncharacterized protein DEU56DRAFT_759012 [Suillus clintonianus]KAG2126045.1 hypothetical protein DEU56DRAFT_759012 [Suillus clintonianus]